MKGNKESRLPQDQIMFRRAEEHEQRTSRGTRLWSHLRRLMDLPSDQGWSAFTGSGAVSGPTATVLGDDRQLRVIQTTRNGDQYTYPARQIPENLRNSPEHVWTHIRNGQVLQAQLLTEQILYRAPSDQTWKTFLGSEAGSEIFNGPTATVLGDDGQMRVIQTIRNGYQCNYPAQQIPPNLHASQVHQVKINVLNGRVHQAEEILNQASEGHLDLEMTDPQKTAFKQLQEEMESRPEFHGSALEKRIQTKGQDGLLVTAQHAPSGLAPIFRTVL